MLKTSDSKLTEAINVEKKAEASASESNIDLATMIANADKDDVLDAIKSHPDLEEYIVTDHS